MEQLHSATGMLDLMVHPAFSVQEGVVTGINQGAGSHMIEVGTPVRTLIHTGIDEYRDFTGGCLYLTLCVCGSRVGASVTRVGGADIFVLEQDSDQAELQAMALAARELRSPLTGMMTAADLLFPMVSEDASVNEQISRINRGLFQMLRVISNMSDAARYTQDSPGPAELRNITSIFEEIFRRSATLIGQTGIRVEFTNLNEQIYCLADEEKLERAVYNILSNAVKFTPAGGTIDAMLTRRDSKLYLTVQDSGCGLDPKVRGSVYSRYQRQAGVEDSRFGIGLGMVLIRSAAAAHGGTVLLESPAGSGTRITMTMQIRQDPGSSVHSTMLKVDYAGERDHGLIELSGSLPPRLYNRNTVN